ncbi:MAG: GNAT family N-acetyltransferase [Nitrosarchaeum sp.]|nr:GNAT family N-acetyltransferase [Nitrosarchaeum sp.]MCA9819695.1 GNAT family N-acetyltransferase [Nitrosarchaeum sp.]
MSEDLHQMISFRGVSKSDLQTLKTWRNSHDVWENNTQFTFLNTKNQEEWFASLRGNPERKMFVITMKKKPVGICGLVHMDEGNADVAIIIGDKKLRGKGIGKTALQKLIKLGFTKFGLNRIGADVLEFNTNSQKFFSGVGFRHEATLRQSIWRKGRWNDTLVYGLSKQEWEKRD